MKKTKLEISDFTTRTEAMTSLLEQMVEVETPTNDKAAIDQLGGFVQGKLQELGAQVQIAYQGEAGNHVIGRWNQHLDQKGFLILCHMDTVHPKGALSRNPCVERDGKLFGPGALDMKAGIVIFLTAIEYLIVKQEMPDCPVTALFTSDEETGSRTSRKLIEQLAQQSGLSLCLEASLKNGALKTWRKGVGQFKIEVHGQAAHAGVDHSNGRNAIEELAHQIIKIQKLTDYSTGTTINVGVINGGNATNVVPDYALAEVDVRVTNRDDATLISNYLSSLTPIIKGTTIKVSGGLNRPPMTRDETMVKSYYQARKIANELGLTLHEGGTGGGSDANFVAPLGVPVLDGLGGWGKGAHTNGEFVVIESLPERAAFLAAILQNWYFS
jgi:glutamate carboxypeptidase